MGWKKICLILFAACCFPYIVTLGWTGAVNGRERILEPAGDHLSSGKQVILDREISTVLDVEQYLVGVVARQMPADYQLEALKAQAVIARTYIYRQMGQNSEIPESALDIDYLEQAQMEKLWGSSSFMEFYQKVEQAVADTNGIVIKYEGELIDPWFCRCSAGKTRAGEEAQPYLVSVDCPEDLEAAEYLQIKEWTREEFSKLISSIPDGGPVSADQVPETIQTSERDSAGYVLTVQIGGISFTGDEIRYALSLHSPHFRLEGYEGGIRAIVKGIGHGYGLSQYEANQKAGAGWDYQQILQYFYQNIVLISE